MNIVEFFKEQKFPKTVSFKDGRKSYKDSDTPYMFIRLPKAIEGTTQEHIVCSRHLAEALRNGEVKPQDCEVSFQNGLYGLIMPDTCKVWKEVELW